MQCRDNKLTDDYLSQLELFSGWVLLDDLVIAFELGAASARVGVKINEIFFRIPRHHEHDQQQDNNTIAASNKVPLNSPLRQWNAFLRGHDRIITCDETEFQPPREMRPLAEFEGDYGISVFDVCACIVRQSNVSNSKTSTAMGAAIYFTVILMIVILYIPLIKHHSALKSTPAIAAFLATATVLIWDYGKTFFFFIYIAALDVKRFLQMTRTLHAMIRMTDLVMHGNLNKRYKRDKGSKATAAEEYDCSGASSVVSASDALEEIAEARMEVILDICCSDSPVQPSERGAVLGVKMNPNLNLAMTPRADLSLNENAVAWSYARATIQNFGDRFRCRIDSYLGKLSFVFTLC
jgi:hypothetical protein